MLDQREGDGWKPENNPDRNLLWRPGGDHSYTTATEYLEALRGGRKEIEQYMERLSRDISRIDEYFVRNYSNRDRIPKDTERAKVEYDRRYAKIKKALTLLKPEGDGWKPENDPNPAAWRPQDDDHSYTTAIDYFEALKDGSFFFFPKKKEEYVDKLSEIFHV